MSVLALGLNQSTAPLDLRGRFAIAPENLSPALLNFRQRVSSPQPEAALLSTCNRTELYVAGDSPGQLVQPALEWLASHGSVSGDSLRSHTYVMEHGAAARHTGSSVSVSSCLASSRRCVARRGVEAALGSEGRVLIRPSGTEPVLRIMVEARDAELARGCADRLAMTLA
jgi:hypothetical protein